MTRMVGCSGGRTEERMGSLWWALAFATVGACSTPPPAESPEPAQEPNSDPEPLVEEPPPEPEPLEEAAEPEEAPPPGPKPTEVVGDVCEATCKKVESACSQRASEFCRASCRDYVGAAESCPVEVHAALSCQNDADDFLLCSNIAAESCANLYREMKRCRAGEVAPKVWGQTEEAVVKSDVPTGFERKAVPAHGFSIPMPKGAKLSAAEKNFEMSAQDASGITYVVKSLELGSTKKPTDVSILRTATQYVGNTCQPKLRLHGRFESQGVIHVRFDTVCEDGSVYHGVLHFWDGKSVVATTKLPRELPAGEKNENLEPFLFGFQRTDAGE